MHPCIVAIIGSTASGKSALGVEIAKRFNGEMISVDSRQVYRGMDVGTGKVIGNREQGLGNRIEDMLEGNQSIMVEGVPHWGIDLVDPDGEFSVAEFKKYADRKIGEIVARGHLPILVGGTGMWLKAVIDNLDLASTPSDPALRAILEARPLGDLFHEYKQLDPAGAEIIDRENRRRVVRALEVTKLTGRPWSEMQTAGKPLYDVLQIGLAVSREELLRRIDERVDQMVAHGLIDEVRRLRERYGCTIESMTGIGYRQVCEFLEGRSTINEAIEETKKATRQYAKRQMTWFKRDPRIVWIEDSQQAAPMIESFLKTKPTG